MASRGRGIVIDASIARGAGESEHAVSSRWRIFLEEVRTVCHHIVISSDGLAEWNRNRSRFARAWWRSMRARRKVNRMEIKMDIDLRDKVCAAARNQQELDGMLKDIHLVEAALQANAPVASLDENTARKPFRSACRTVRRLRRVVWVNPTADSEFALEWLQTERSTKTFDASDLKLKNRVDDSDRLGPKEKNQWKRYNQRRI